MMITNIIPLALSYFSCCLAAACNTYNVPSTTWAGSVTAELTSQPGGLGAFDGQKLKPYPNTTSFDWWYFDVVSTTSPNESFVIVFIEAGSLSLTTPTPGGLLVNLGGTFKNGSSYLSVVSAQDGASFEMCEDKISSEWSAPDWSMGFEGNRDAGSCGPTYTVRVNVPSEDISGTFTLRSVAPPRYPCAPEAVGVSEEVGPDFGWANIIPDAQATVDLTIKGEPVSFSGVGYHDKNWSERSFSQLIAFWYWGHARLGPYSIVWFDLRAAGSNTQHQSGFIAKDGETFYLGCEDGASSVRPWGENSEYPPSVLNPGPSGLVITFDLGDKGTFVANVTNDLVVLNAGNYQRHIGKVTGGVVGEEVFEGNSFFEVMHLAPATANPDS